MFRITNTIITEPALLPVTDFWRLPVLERQHVNYLHHLSTQNPMTVPISYENARNEILCGYSSEFIEETTELDIEEEVNEYNRLAAYKHIHFIDWFALRDYKKAGYVRINERLRDAATTAEINAAPDIRQLHLTLMHLTLLQTHDNLPENQTLFRGDVQPLEHVLSWEKGDIFSSEAFLSTSTDEKTVLSFYGDSETIEENHVNVLYEIYNDNPYSGANITEILHDGEDEFLFLPKTQFVITDTQFYPSEKKMRVSLSTCYSTEAELTQKLHALIFK